MTDDLIELLLTAHRLPVTKSQLVCDKAAARIGQQAARIVLLEKALEEHGGRYWEARYRDEAAENKRLREGFNAILDRGPEREPKWAGMTAKDIAIYCLKGPDHD
ncbi:MAG: hypothetical protein RLZZ387_2603 [Chloroflexota bacterium]|jgi:hypothetical protein